MNTYGNHFLRVSETFSLPVSAFFRWSHSGTRCISPCLRLDSSHRVLYRKGLAATDPSNLKRFLLASFPLFSSLGSYFPTKAVWKCFFLLHYYPFVFHFVILLSQHPNYISCCGDTKRIANSGGYSFRWKNRSKRRILVLFLCSCFLVTKITKWY